MIHHKIIILFMQLLPILCYHLALCPCTGIRLQASDGTIVYARTLEWRKNLQPHAIIIPRNVDYVGTSTSNKCGLRWKSDCAFTGITLGQLPYVIDGVNEAGLAAGLFSFRDDIEYHTPDNNTNNDLAPWELVTYLLSTCQSVQDVKNALPKIKIVPVYFDLVDEIPPLHYIVHDVSGNCIVLEHSYNSFKIYDNPLGIMANSPNFDWHITHLNTYLYPSFDNYKISHHKSLHESYALGLPSDFSSPSRFIRAAIYTLCSPIVQTGYESVLQAFHILNQFDIPKGAFRTVSEDYFTYTHWTSAVNLQERKYYFRTHQNQRIRLIDLSRVDFNGTKIMWFAMDQAEDIEYLI